jgi:hypothetical protein
LQKLFKLMCEADIGAYLGMMIINNSSGLLEGTQPGLRDTVIIIFGLKAESNEHQTPTDAILMVQNK